jgi:GntR family transcriptional regulator
MNLRTRIIPKYFQVEQLLRRRISALPPGTALPPEAELVKEYGVSRMTLRVAVGALEVDGLVTRVQGRGTFVSQERLDIQVGYQSRASDTVKTETDVVHKLTSFGRAPAAQEECQMFGLKSGAAVLRVERVTWKGEMSLGFGSLVVPAALAKGLTQRDFEHGRFFNTLVDHGLRIARYRLVIESSIIPPVLAETLGVRSGLPAISLTRTGYARNAQAIAQVEIMTRGDVGRYVLEADFNSTNASMSLDSAGKSK